MTQSLQALDSEAQVIYSTKKWVETFVIGMNLCPFAKREWEKSRVKIEVSKARNEEDLLIDLELAMHAMNRNPEIETVLLVHPKVLSVFEDYNQFLDIADDLLGSLELDGVLQIASFHPDYQFAETTPIDAENYSNRSPYPMLHLLREDSLEEAVENHPNPSQIPENNITLLNKKGHKALHALRETCFEK